MYGAYRGQGDGRMLSGSNVFGWSHIIDCELAATTVCVCFAQLIWYGTSLCSVSQFRISEFDNNNEVCYTTPKLGSQVNHKAVDYTTPLSHESVYGSINVKS